jgi:heavy metal sensor kinase
MTSARERLFRFFRTLRFRLAATFLLLLAAVLIVVSFLATRNLNEILEAQGATQLKAQIGTLKGWFSFDERTGQPLWDEVDVSDQEEVAELAKLRSVYVIAEDNGTLYQATTDPKLAALWNRRTILSELAQIQQTGKPVLKTIRATDGTPYQVLSSVMMDNKHNRRWYVAEGRSLAEDRVIVRKFQRQLIFFFPFALIGCAIVSWYSAGGILRGLQSVERAAQEITGSNLGLQIPKRGAEDELDRLIDSFNAMSGRLKASFEQIRQFSTDVSHELRTPLTAIQGQLEVALFTATRKEQLQEAIENALQDVERLSNLVRALLLLSQSESGQIPLRKTVLDLSRITAEIVEQFQIPAEAEEVSLSHNAPASVFCEADRTQLERVITNLLSNAIKYTPRGGRVRTQVERVGPMVRLTVEDSGVGIPKDHLPHIFDRFYRVPDPNPEKGLGLGLSFVAAIIKAHGGQIRVHSEVGKGSRFDVYLPQASAPRTQITEPRAASEASR